MSTVSRTVGKAVFALIVIALGKAAAVLGRLHAAGTQDLASGLEDNGILARFLV